MSKIIAVLLSLQVWALALTLPNSLYKQSHITPSSSYQIFQQMREAKTLFQKGDIKGATPIFIRTLLTSSKSSADKNIDQYDYLYAHNGILTAIERDEKHQEAYIKLSKKILSYLDQATERGIWEEGELGKYQLKMYQVVGNALAKKLYKASKRKDKKLMKQALYYINKAEKYIRSDKEFYIKETKEKITNALAGNPMLKSEKERLTITKIIKSDKDKKKVSKDANKSLIKK